MTKGRDDIEKQAWEDLTRAPAEETRADLGLGSEWDGEVLTTWCEAVDHPLLNRVFGLGEGVPATPGQVARILSRFGRAGLGRYWVHLARGAEPASLPEWLAGHGLEPYRRAFVRLVREGQAPPPKTTTDLTVEPVRDRRSFARIFCRGFDLPDRAEPIFQSLVGRRGWHCYAAVDGATPVAVGALYVADGQGYVAGAATEPEHRGRGAQTALLAKRIQVALALGCERLVSETGEAVAGVPNHSHDNMVRLGFVPVEVRPNYAPRGWVWDHGRDRHDVAAGR